MAAQQQWFQRVLSRLTCRGHLATQARAEGTQHGGQNRVGLREKEGEEGEERGGKGRGGPSEVREKKAVWLGQVVR